MEKKYAQLKVGIFALVSVILIFFILLWGKDFKYMKSKYKTYMMFNSSSGLDTGDAVAVRGVIKGRVDDISLKNNKVIVTVSIENDVVLYEDCRAYIMNMEIMGGRKIEIDPGISGKIISAKDTIRGEATASLLEITPYIIKIADNINSTVSKLDTTLFYINQIINEPQRVKKLDEILDNLQSSSISINQFLKDNKNNFETTLNNISRTSKSLSNLLDNNQKKIRYSIDKFVRLANNMDTLSTSLNTLISDIEKGKGTLGKLMSDDEIYLSLKNAVTDLDSVSKSIKKNFARFLKNTNFQLIKVF